jgi:hypothetical protein
VNKNFIGRTRKEYYEDNKDKLIIKSKQYYNDNKGVVLEKSKQYRENNKDAICAQKKIYRSENATKIKEHKGEPKICECGSSYTHAHKARHSRSLKHKQYLETLTNI